MKPKSIHENSLVLTNGKITRDVLDYSCMLLSCHALCFKSYIDLPWPLFYIIQKIHSCVLLRGENK